MVDVTINLKQTIVKNKLSLGFQLDWASWIGFINIAERRRLAKDANFKLIRVFDFRKTTPPLMPCTHWDEATKTGTWDWTQVDALTQAIFSVGAEPLYCLGYGRPNIQNYIPSGMAVNPSTELPYPDSYAAYAAEWVKHFKQRRFPVRFYEIMNEPETYFGWTPNTTKLSYYSELWNASVRAMRAINPNLKVSQDSVTRKAVLEHWIQHGDDLDYLDFHKYDHYGTETWVDDATVLARAETRYFETGATAWGVEEARQMWFNARGKLLPVINSESNFNPAWENGTDPRIQQMVGAVWLGLVLRTGILKGLNYNVFFEFSSSKSYGEGTPSGGFGFGMINSDDCKPWYSYYVHWMMGRNLSVGDTVFETDSTSENVRVIAWKHHRKLNILLICKTTSPQTINLQGVTGQLNATWIDNTFPYTNPTLQTAILNVENPITLNGYTVMLLQQAMPISLATIGVAGIITLIIIGGTYYFVTRRG